MEILEEWGLTWSRMHFGKSRQDREIWLRVVKLGVRNTLSKLLAASIQQQKHTWKINWNLKALNTSFNSITDLIHIVSSFSDNLKMEVPSPSSTKHVSLYTCQGVSLLRFLSYSPALSLTNSFQCLYLSVLSKPFKYYRNKMLWDLHVAICFLEGRLKDKTTLWSVLILLPSNPNFIPSIGSFKSYIATNRQMQNADKSLG